MTLKKYQIKKLVAFMLLTFLFVLSIPANLTYAENSAPTRIINVVYDDSGSMIYDDKNKQKVDTWCQAKYSMEVFAAMLGQKDTMNIYVMSDYYNKSADSPRLTLRGGDGAKANVKKVHDLLTETSETPFNSVRKAYEDLKTLHADEKWLVILTDGEFNDMDGNGVDMYFSSKEPDIKVMFLGMGASAAAITEKPSQDIYFEKAETSDQILNKVTDICTRIFNMDKLPDVKNKHITFDVPMSELTVFAQGASVEIKGFVGPDGNTIESNAPVEVMYSEMATTKQRPAYSDPKLDTELVGRIITYKGDFDPGTYSLNVSGAETLEVYYKPNIELMAYLVDDKGRETMYSEGVRAGDYQLYFGFVKAGTTEKIPESPLLGNVNYQARVRYNGVVDGVNYSSGDTLAVREGRYDVEVTANYLKYNTVSAVLGFDVFRDRRLDINIEETPEYRIIYEGDVNGFYNDDMPIRVRASLEGVPFTAEQWADMGNLKLTRLSDKNSDIELTVKKTDEIGIYHVFLRLQGEPGGKDYTCDIPFDLELQHLNGNELWYGDTQGTVHITDARSWIRKHWEIVVKLVIGFSLLAFLLGYVPGIKKYLPKRLKSRPVIKVIPKKRGIKVPDGYGKLTKNRLTTFLPYIPEKGKIRCVPKGKSGLTLKVRAAGGGRMDILNIKEIAGNPKITIGGITVPAGTKKKTISAGTNVKIDANELTYECTLNQ